MVTDGCLPKDREINQKKYDSAWIKKLIIHNDHNKSFYNFFKKINIFTLFNIYIFKLIFNININMNLIIYRYN